MTDFPPPFPDAWLPCAIKSSQKMQNGCELLILENQEKVIVHHGTGMIYRNIKDFEIKRWVAEHAD
jgi:hypothetical protein